MNVAQYGSVSVLSNLTKRTILFEHTIDDRTTLSVTYQYGETLISRKKCGSFLARKRQKPR